MPDMEGKERNIIIVLESYRKKLGKIGLQFLVRI
jgi:hypothetical protein